MRWMLLIIMGLMLLSLQSCPECIPPEPSIQTDSDVIFVGKSLNSNKPGVFLVNNDGTNLHELIPNATIYSPVSKDGKIAFLREINQSKIQLMKYSLRNNDLEFPIDDSSYPEKMYAIRSNNGNKITFFTKNKEIVVGENGVWYSEKYDICPKTLPVFSPDSRYIAFFIGDSLEAPLRINIIDSDNPGILVDYKELAFGVSGLPGLAKLDWSHQDLILYSYTKTENIDIIGVWNLENPSKSFEIELKENLGAFNPILSPDRTKILFTARDGNLWIRNFTEDTLNPAFWEDLTRVDEGEFLAYPQWSKDGRRILYTRYFKNRINDEYSGKLEILENVGTDSMRIRIICDGVRQAFWRDN